MGRLTPRWRRYWGLRPGALGPPLRVIAHGQKKGEAVSGPHGRRRLSRDHVPKESTEPVTTAAGFPLTVVADDDVPEQARAHAIETLVHVAEFARRPVLHGRVTIRLHRDPALERPVVVKAALDVSGRSVRAHVAARQPIEAIDLLAKRLRRNLESLDERTRERRREPRRNKERGSGPGDLARARPEPLPRPPEERELIRRKTYARLPVTPEDAALEMQRLDYDFYLFTNAETGEENVISRDSDGGHAAVQTAPVLLLEDVIERLDAGGERFVFFLDAQRRRGHVLYRRFDGHYGLLEPEPDG